MLQDILVRKSSCVVIVGHSGAGKSTLASLLASQCGIKVIEVGHQVIMEATGSNMTPLEFADEQIRSGKQLHFVEQLLAAHDLTSPIIVVGPRLPQEVRFLKDALGPTIVIGLDAPDGIREFRRCRRSEIHKGRPTWMRHRDLVERSWGAENTLEMAHAVLDATLKPSQLLTQAAGIWEELGVNRMRKSVSYFFMQDIGHILNSPQSSSEALDESSLLQVVR